MSLADAGIHVDLYSPRPVERYMPIETTGINATPPIGEVNSPQTHFDDSMTASGGNANAEFLRGMCNDAPGVVNLLDRLGVPFDRASTGRVKYTTAPGSNYPRTAAAGDETGRHIHRVLCDQARRWEKAGRLMRREYREVLDFILDKDGVCIGLVSLEIKSMTVSAQRYDAVIVATGSPLPAFGDCRGIADDYPPMVAAYRKGAKWINPHMYTWEDGSKPVIAERPSGDNVSPDIIHFYEDKPFAKRHIGGLRIDSGFRTDIPNLYAAGECAHLGEGEGILVGNELLMDVYSGLKCAASVVEFLKSQAEPGGEFTLEKSEEYSEPLRLTFEALAGSRPDDGDPTGPEMASLFVHRKSQLIIVNHLINLALNRSEEHESSMVISEWEKTGPNIITD